MDLVCHGKTEIVPDKDGSDPYQVGRAGPLLSTTWLCVMFPSQVPPPRRPGLTVPVWELGRGEGVTASPVVSQEEEAGC